jgi:hypothetical protein
MSNATIDELFDWAGARLGGPPLGLGRNGALFSPSTCSTTTRSRLWKAALVAAIALPAANGTVRASGLPFTWDPSQASPPLSGAGSAFTADTIDATNYLHSIIETNGSFVEQLVLNIGGFQLNGQPVTAPGLDTTYGLYFAIDATGQLIAGKTTFNTLNISLMADPGNNDGTLSATIAGISFSNTGPTGVADDFTLGTGSLLSASMAFNPFTKVRTAHYVENFAPEPNETGFFGNFSPLLEVFLTTPPAAFQALPQPDGTTVILVNDGIARADFVPEPASIVLLVSGLLGLGVVHRRRTHAPNPRLTSWRRDKTRPTVAV